jgi:CheY-like chemotaxis protein
MRVLVVEDEVDLTDVVARGLCQAGLAVDLAYDGDEALEKAIRKRQVWVEPLFAEAKEWHGLRRLCLRGLRNANIQGLLIAAG